MEVREYLLTTDSFEKPTILTGKRAIANLITKLLLLEPGKNPLHPGMGVGIGTKYRFITENDIPSLESLIARQMSTYLPNFQTNKVKLEIQSGKYLNINIQISDTIYVYESEKSSSPLQLAG